MYRKCFSLKKFTSSFRPSMVLFKSSTYITIIFSMRHFKAGTHLVQGIKIENQQALVLFPLFAFLHLPTFEKIKKSF